MRARWMFLVLLAVPVLASAGRTARLTDPKGTIEETTPTFTWSAVDSATQYDIWVVGGSGIVIADSIAPATGCTDGVCSFSATDPLTPGTYLWIVLSRIPGSNDRWSNPRRFVVSPDGTRPGRVELIAPSGEIGTTTPAFSWNDAGTNVEYELVVTGGRPRTFFRQVFAGSAICVNDVCTAPPNVTNLALGDGNYKWTVRGWGIGGAGPRSHAMNFNVQTLPRPPERPTLVAPHGRGSETSPAFVWNVAARATDYYLEIRGRGGDVHGQWYTADATLCPDTTCAVTPAGVVLDHGRYRFKVTGKNAAGEGRPSRAMRFRVGDFLDQPVGVAPTGATTTSPTFQWHPVANATHYMLQLRKARRRVGMIRYEAADICDQTMCSAELAMVLAEGSYLWRVTANSNNHLPSSPSERLEFEAKAGGGSAPEAPEALLPDGNVDTKTPTFKWTFVGGATMYKLTVKDEFDPVLYSHTYSSADAQCTTTDGCHVTPTEMLVNGNYSFFIEAINDAGSSPPSGRKNFTVVAGGATPGTPEILRPTGTVPSATPEFAWRPVMGATNYILMVKDASNPVVYSLEYGTDICAAECVAMPNEILGDGTYTFFVTAKIGDVAGQPGEGRFTVDTSATPGASTPVAPIGRTMQRNPEFRWSVVDQVIAYTLVVSDNNGGPERHNTRYELADLTCSATECLITPSPGLDLEDGVYEFTVTTENAAGMMTPSNVASFTVAATPSTLRVTSHNDGDMIPDSGVVISGTVDASTVSLTAELVNGIAGMPSRNVEISVNNVWSVFLMPGQLTPGAATLTLSGSDGANVTSTLDVNFNVVAADIKESMLLARATFGVTPALLNEVKTSGASTFQDRLFVDISDPGFDALVASLPTSTDNNVREYALMHALFSPNPLEEVMTQFWDNHFSTSMRSHDVPEFELRENNNFRANAFGRFRDLLEISAKSPAMLIYLDATNNVVGDPNENYSRELLELSTMGVNGGYTQTDIENLARILTGWKEVGGQFQFVSGDHDFGTKQFLGTSFPTPAGAGLAEGEAVLDMLSDHPSTAAFICTKLIEHFITESPGAALVSSCATEFLDRHRDSSTNQMELVLRLLFNSAEFSDPTNFRAKVKTPLELLASTVRLLDATVEDRDDLERDLDNDLDMELFGHPAPDGFSETADDWIDTGLLLSRVNFVNEIARETGARDTYVDIVPYFQNKGYETAEGIVGYLFEIAFYNEFTPLELSIAYDILSARGTSQFDINGVDAETRLRQLVGTILSFPGFQHQ